MRKNEEILKRNAQKGGLCKRNWYNGYVRKDKGFLDEETNR